MRKILLPVIGSLASVRPFVGNDWTIPGPHALLVKAA
jgi:hypothetical protein